MFQVDVVRWLRVTWERAGRCEITFNISMPTVCSRWPSAVFMCREVLSKFRKSRRATDRGPKRAAKRAERARLHNFEHGREYISDCSSCSTVDAPLLLFSGPWACIDSVVASIYNMGVNRRSEVCVHEGASEHRAAFDVRFMDSLIKEIPDGQEKYLKVVDGVPRCFVCGKRATERHVASQAHILKIEEEAILNILGSNLRSLRATKCHLCVGVATKRLILEFWGEAIQRLPEAAKRIHEEKGVFYVEGKMDRPVYPRCCSYELGVVSFSHGCKRDVSTYISWRDLPDREESAEEEQLKRLSPVCQGWWPVVSLRRIHTTVCGWQVLLVCCYRLFSDGPVSATWIYSDYNEAVWEQTMEPVFVESAVEDFVFDHCGVREGILGGCWAEHCGPDIDPWSFL